MSTARLLQPTAGASRAYRTRPGLWEGSGGGGLRAAAEWQDFTSSSGARPGLGLVCPAAPSGRHPPLAVEDVLRVALLLPLSGPGVLLLLCLVGYRLGGGGCSLPHGGGTADPVHGCFFSVWSTSRRFPW